MKVLFSSGGTGGHISPALAMADIIKSNVRDASIAFVGTPRGMENSIIPDAGYKLFRVDVRGIRRSLSPQNIKSLYLAATSPAKAKKIIREFEPDIIIGTGGYACWPAIKAGTELGIPTVLHESNAIPGLAVRRLQESVDVVMTNFESTKQLLSPKANVINVGNPLRSACTSISKAEARARLGIDPSVRFVVLSFGGSLGSEMLNRASAQMMGDFAAKHDDIKCFHVGGKRYFEDARRCFLAYGIERNPNFVLMEYTSDLPIYMQAADVVICRAGAMTLTEIARMGKAAVIIPSPNVTDNHQYKNAKVLADADSAFLIEESELSDGGMSRVAEAVERLYGDADLRTRMSENIKQFAKDDVEKRIFEIISSLTAGKKISQRED